VTAKGSQEHGKVVLAPVRRSGGRGVPPCDHDAAGEAIAKRDREIQTRRPARSCAPRRAHPSARTFLRTETPTRTSPEPPPRSQPVALNRAPFQKTRPQAPPDVEATASRTGGCFSVLTRGPSPKLARSSPRQALGISSQCIAVGAVFPVGVGGGDAWHHARGGSASSAGIHLRVSSPPAGISVIEVHPSAITVAHLSRLLNGDQRYEL
jgi:hypothetical protein